MVLQSSVVQLKFLNEIRGLGGIRFVEEGAGGRARLGREKHQRYNYLGPVLVATLGGRGCSPYL